MDKNAKCCFIIFYHTVAFWINDINFKQGEYGINVMNWLIYTCKNEHMHSQCEENAKGSQPVTSDGRWVRIL